MLQQTQRHMRLALIPPLNLRQRLLLNATLIIMITICAALIIFQPGTRTFTMNRAAPVNYSRQVALGHFW